MRYLSLFAATAAIMALASCSTPSGQNASETNVTDEAAGNYAPLPTSTGGEVIELTDPAVYAPGVKVPQLTVLDFNAVWCGPCRQLAPVFEEMALKYEGKATFVSVDVDKFGELFEAYRMGQSIPAVLFLKPDGTSKKYIGTGELLPADKFDALIKANL